MQPLQAKVYAYKMSYSPVCIFYLQPSTLAIHKGLLLCILLQVVAVSLLVAANKPSVQSMKFIKKFNQQLQPRMFSRCYSCGIYYTCGNRRTHHHFLPSTSPFSTWNALALTRFPKGVAVHKLLIHLDFQGSRCPVYGLCWGNPRVPLAPIILKLL